MKNISENHLHKKSYTPASSSCVTWSPRKTFARGSETSTATPPVTGAKAANPPHHQPHALSSGARLRKDGANASRPLPQHRTETSHPAQAAQQPRLQHELLRRPRPLRQAQTRAAARKRQSGGKKPTVIHKNRPKQTHPLHKRKTERKNPPDFQSLESNLPKHPTSKAALNNF